VKGRICKDNYTGEPAHVWGAGGRVPLNSAFVCPKASSRMQKPRQRGIDHSALRSSAQRLLHACSSRDKGISITARHVRQPKGFFTHAAGVTKGEWPQRLAFVCPEAS